MKNKKNKKKKAPNSGCFGGKKVTFGKAHKNPNGTSVQPINVGGGIGGAFITGMNGVKANDVLNKASKIIEPLYENNKDIVCGFDMGFDGVWEYTVKNVKTNKAVVLKGVNGHTKQKAFVYNQAFDQVDGMYAQVQPDKQYMVKNNNVVTFIKKAVIEMS